MLEENRSPKSFKIQKENNIISQESLINQNCAIQDESFDISISETVVEPNEKNKSTK
jgi:hypothetical protein